MKCPLSIRYIKELVQIPSQVDQEKELTIIFGPQALDSDQSIKEIMKLFTKVRYFDGFGNNKLSFLQDLEHVKFCDSDSMIQNYLWPGDE